MEYGKGSPPLARGTAKHGLNPSVVIRITPACAGNSYFFSAPLKRRGDHPRLRGEQSLKPWRYRTRQGSPPLARGTVDIFGTAQVGTGITPACAGNSGLYLAPRPVLRDHPRLRGEQSTDIYRNTVKQGSPPLARGTAEHMHATPGNCGITPACAGNRRRYV